MKILTTMMLLSLSLGAFAQSRGNQIGGRIQFGDGQSTVRISVNERSDVNLRIRLLEEAVRDLQAQVYDLRDASPATRIVTSHVCSLTTNFDGTFVGKASSQVEAIAIARQKCDASGASFCNTSVPKITCEKVVEELRLR
jgi:hypothetical protein